MIQVRKVCTDSVTENVEKKKNHTIHHRLASQDIKPA